MRSGRPRVRKDPIEETMSCGRGAGSERYGAAGECREVGAHRQSHCACATMWGLIKRKNLGGGRAGRWQGGRGRYGCQKGVLRGQFRVTWCTQRAQWGQNYHGARVYEHGEVNGQQRPGLATYHGLTARDTTGQWTRWGQGSES